MPVNRKTRLQYRSLFEKLGVEVVEEELCSNSHAKFVVQYNGKRRIFVAAGSPSDRRGMLNFKSDVRKWIRGVTYER